MGRYFKLSILSLLLLLTSCQEGREAGDLLGQWRMTDRYYISFSGSIALFRSISEGYVYGNFQHRGDSLFIQCYSIKASPADTLVIEQSYGFKPFSNIRLKINVLNEDKLVLSKGNQTWCLEKY